METSRHRPLPRFAASLRKLAAGLLAAAPLFSYALSVSPVRADPPETVYAANNSQLFGDDAVAGPFSLGFNFPFFGVTQSSAYLETNGLLSFDTSFSGFDNQALPTSGPGAAIMPFWDDLITQGNSAKSVYYQTIGSPGSRTFIAQWTNMYFFDNQSLQLGTFQVLLNESDGSIQLQYRDVLGSGAPQGTGATVGLQKDNATGLQYSLNSAVLSSHLAIKYTPDGSGSYTADNSAPYQYVYLTDSQAPDAPSLTSPADASSNISLTPTLSWQAANLATSYTVLVATDAAFTSILVNQQNVGATFYDISPALSNSTTYYWRIEADNSFGQTLSTASSFTTVAPTPPPNNPANLGPSSLTNGGYVQGTLPAFRFSLSDPNISNTLRYQIQISTHSDYSSPTVDYTSKLDSQGSRLFTLGQAVNGGSYAAGSGVSHLSDGSYYWRVSAISPAGLAGGWSSPVGIAFQIDTVPPVFSPITATSNNGFSSGIARVGNTVTIQFTSSKTLAGNPSVSLGGQPASFVSSSGLDYAYTRILDGTEAEGNSAIVISGTDTIGNSGSGSSSFTLDFTAPAPPAVTLPATATSTNQNSYQVSGTAEANSLVVIRKGATLVGSRQLSGGATSFSITAPLTSSTSNAFTAYATDGAGNTSTASLVPSITQDTVAPSTPALTIPAFGALFSTHTPPLAANTYFDTQSPQQAAEWQLASDVAFTAPVDSGTDTVHLSSYVSPSLQDGTWWARVRYQDQAGNWSAWSSSVSFAVDTILPPQPAVITPNDVAFTSQNNYQIRGTTIADGLVTVLQGGVNVGTQQLGGGSTNFGITVSLHPNLANDFTVYVTNAVGNRSAGSAVPSITQDASSPGTPAITAPADGSSMATHAPVLHATAYADNISPQAFARWEVATDSSFASPRIDSGLDSSDILSYATANVADGTYWARVQYIDAANNVSDWSSPIRFTIDTTAPGITLGSFSAVSSGRNPLKATSGDTVTVTFTADEPLASNPDVTLGGQPLSLVTSSGRSYTYFRLLDGSETEGANSPIVLSLTDPAGTIGVTGSSFNIDRTPPASPASLQATPSSSGSPEITLAWKPPVGSDLTSQLVYRSGKAFASGKLPSGLPLATVTATAASFVDPDIAAGTDYYYEVLSSDDAGNLSLPAGQADALVASTVVAISNLSALPQDSHVLLRFSPLPDGYLIQVYRSDTSGGASDLIGTTNSADFTDTTTAAGRTYYYTLYAVLASGAVSGTINASVKATVPPAGLFHPDQAPSLANPPAAIAKGVQKSVPAAAAAVVGITAGVGLLSAISGLVAQTGNAAHALQLFLVGFLPRRRRSWGVVKDRDSGLPLVGAQIVLGDALGKEIDRTGTDRYGRFSLVVPQPGEYQVYADAPGHRRSAGSTLKVENPDKPPASLTIRLSATAPDPKALSSFRRFSSFNSILSFFHIPALVIGGTVTGYSFYLTRESSNLYLFLFYLVLGIWEAISAARTARNWGTVVDERDGKPLFHAAVTFYALTDDKLDLTPVTTLSTDQKGRYRVRLQPGSYRLHASHQGYLFRQVDLGYVKASEPASHNVRLVPELVFE